MLTTASSDALQAEREAEAIIRRLANGGTLKGAKYLVRAVCIVLSEPDILKNLVKCLYVDLAKAFNATPARVERNIRTVITTIWKNNRPLLEEIAGFPLSRVPTNSQFIDYVAHYIRPDYQLNVR